MSYLALKKINKIYPNGFHAVHDFNLEIEKGEFIVFVGPSGCGKSTTLRMIAGLEDISNGDFLINDKRANEMGPREREVAMVFQSYALFPHYDVFDNVAYGLVNKKMDKKTIHDKVMEMVELVGLRGMEHRMPNQLSGGQQQRVAIARALAAKPSIILADEPTGNLDSKTSMDVIALLKLTGKEFAQTIVMITHNEEIATMADQMIRIEDGRIFSAGVPDGGEKDA